MFATLIRATRALQPKAQTPTPLVFVKHEPSPLDLTRVEVCLRAATENTTIYAIYGRFGACETMAYIAEVRSDDGAMSREQALASANAMAVALCPRAKVLEDGHWEYEKVAA